jgi:peptide/nickel transport system ATP-binding protein
MSLLTVKDLRVSYRTTHGSLLAVDGVDLSLEAGSTLGLVGESGSGKSTLAKAIVGLAPVSSGRITFGDEDIGRASGAALKRIRKRVQMIFQDPYSSLNPRMTVGQAIEEPMAEHLDLSRSQRRAETARLLELVGLAEADAQLYPFQFSGGQRQRIAIARALAVQPELIVADEITSALDVSVQSTVLNLLRELQRTTGVALLLISHNLAVVRYLSPQVAIMHHGRVVEAGPTQELFSAPMHPYTKVLLDSVPRLHRREGRPVRVKGEPADPSLSHLGCRFQARCPVGPLANPERTICKTDDPCAGAAMRPHRAACHYPLGPLQVL